MKHTSRLISGAACLAALIVPACATEGYGPGYAEEPDQLVLFDGSSFSGASMPVNGPIPDLVDYRFNDSVSSIAVNFGSWEICEDSNFRGRCEIIDENAPNLQFVRMNDSISSIRPAGAPGYGTPGYAEPGYGSANPYGELVFYSDTHMRGDSLPVNRDETDLVRAGFNDRASSVEIRSGVWQICTDDGFRGRCETVDRSVPNLGEIGLSDNISSVRMIAAEPAPRY